MLVLAFDSCNNRGLRCRSVPSAGSFFQGVDVSSVNLLIGLVFAVLAGYLAIVLVKKLVLTKRFHYFAIYTFVLGVILISLALLGSKVLSFSLSTDLR